LAVSASVFLVSAIFLALSIFASEISCLNTASSNSVLAAALKVQEATVHKDNHKASSHCAAWSADNTHSWSLLMFQKLSHEVLFAVTSARFSAVVFAAATLSLAIVSMVASTHCFSASAKISSSVSTQLNKLDVSANCCLCAVISCNFWFCS
jgi:hypothetical protein